MLLALEALGIRSLYERCTNLVVRSTRIEGLVSVQTRRENAKMTNQ
jgi:hypothetical protein